MKNFGTVLSRNEMKNVLGGDCGPDEECHSVGGGGDNCGNPVPCTTDEYCANTCILEVHCKTLGVSKYCDL
ncbi:MAG: hypothetical protein JWN76_493 [Chitinophagaceae bacterium]|nr:hypothetical protein [Chitinophagaceae bacterium]